ncbi:hypothetical protein D3C81_565990 [compost metagenome]
MRVPTFDEVLKDAGISLRTRENCGKFYIGDIFTPCFKKAPSFLLREWFERETLRLALSDYTFHPVRTRSKQKLHTFDRFCAQRCKEKPREGDFISRLGFQLRIVCCVQNNQYTLQ